MRTKKKVTASLLAAATLAGLIPGWDATPTVSASPYDITAANDPRDPDNCPGGHNGVAGVYGSNTWCRVNGQTLTLQSTGGSRWAGQYAVIVGDELFYVWCLEDNGNHPRVSYPAGATIPGASAGAATSFYGASLQHPELQTALMLLMFMSADANSFVGGMQDPWTGIGYSNAEAAAAIWALQHYVVGDTNASGQVIVPDTNPFAGTPDAEQLFQSWVTNGSAITDITFHFVPDQAEVPASGPVNWQVEVRDQAGNLLPAAIQQMVSGGFTVTAANNVALASTGAPIEPGDFINVFANAADYTPTATGDGRVLNTVPVDRGLPMTLSGTVNWFSPTSWQGFPVETNQQSTGFYMQTNDRAVEGAGSLEGPVPPTADVHLRKQVTVDDGATWHNAQTGAPYTVDAGTDDQEFDNAPAAAGDSYPVVMAGGEASYRYQVWLDPQSTGWVNWADVSSMIVDDNGTPADPSDDFNPVYVSGDDGDGMLELGETWLFDDGGNSRTLAAGDDITNIATLITGQVIDPETGDPTGDSSTIRTDPARVAAVGASVVTQVSSQTSMIGDTISDTITVTAENAGIAELNPDVTLRLYNITDDPACAGTPISTVTLADVPAGAVAGLLPHLVAASEAGDNLGYIEQVAIPELGWVGAWSQCGLAAETTSVTQPTITTNTNAVRRAGETNFDDGTVAGVPATFEGTIQLQVYRYIPGGSTPVTAACTADRLIHTIDYSIVGPGVHRSPEYTINPSELKGVQYVHVETLIAEDGTVLASEACGNTSEITTIDRPIKKGYLIKTV